MKQVSEFTAELETLHLEVLNTIREYSSSELITFDPENPVNDIYDDYIGGVFGEDILNTDGDEMYRVSHLDLQTALDVLDAIQNAKIPAK